MLWRIEHPGQTKPSYLYTVPSHNTENLFHFPDSLYHALETLDNISLVRTPKDILEVAIDSYMAEGGIQSVMLKEAVSPALWPKYAPLLKEKFGKAAEDITLWETIEFYGRLKKSFDPSSPFHTEADLYLYEYARRLQKPINGLHKLRTPEGKVFIPVSESELQWITGDVGSSAQKKLTGRLIAAYLDGDLKKMREICSCGQSGDAFHEQELKRVAVSIDSQAALKPTLFIVPLGYFLSERNLTEMMPVGTKITAVGSVNRLSPSQKPLPAAPNQTTLVVDRLRNRYKAQLPGEYFEKSFGNVMEMFVGTDIYEESTYLLVSFPAMYTQGGNIDETIKQFLGEKKLPAPRKIEKNGVSGQEYLVKSGQQEKRVQVYRDEDLLFFAMLGRENTKLASGMGELFFDSLEILKPSKAGWQTFFNEKHGFSLNAPGPLKYDPVMSNAKLKDPRWKLSVYSNNDPSTGMMYLVTVASASADLFVANDSLYMEDVRKNTLEAISAPTQNSLVRKNGRMVLFAEGETKTPGVFASIQSINRKNEVFTPAVIYYENQRNDPRIRRFLDGFDLSERSPSAFGEFTIRLGLANTMAPSPFVENMDTTSDVATAISINSRDSATSEVYSVILMAAGNKQWYRNAGEYWEEKLGMIGEEGDSVISQRPVINGNAEGYHVVLRSGKIDKHIRMMPYADSLVALITVSEAGDSLSTGKQSFFEAFRFLDPYRPPVLMHSRAQELLDNLLSSDSAVFHSALNLMDDAPFSVADIPALRKALLNHYPLATYSSIYPLTPTEKISKALMEIGDPSIASYAMKAYLQPSERTLLEQSLLLNLIAQDPRSNTFRFISEQLLSVPADSLIAEDVFYSMCNDPDELSFVFPDMLPLINHTSMQNGMLALINNMLQRDSIKPEMILPYEKQILTLLEKGMETPENEEEPGYYDSQYRAMNIAGKIASPECERLLNKAVATYKKDLKLRATMELVIMNKPPAPSILESLAANPDFRYHMYEEMFDQKKEALFPSGYARQNLMAESYLWTKAGEEGNTLSINAAGQKQTTIEGTPLTVYFFIIDFIAKDGSPTPRLAMAVFPADKKDLLLYNEYHAIHWDREYKKKDKEKMMAEMMDWLKE